MRVHAVEDASRANGPGLRAVVWVQGCTLGCPGCFNPETHNSAGGVEADTAVLAQHLIGSARRLSLDGISVSGGEPFQQPEALLDVLARLRTGGVTSLLVFSGFTLDEIRRLQAGPRVLDHVDVLVAGRYERDRPLGRGLLGSSNQEVHLLTRRHTAAEVAATPEREVILHRDGTLVLSGIDPHGTRFPTVKREGAPGPRSQGSGS